MLKAAWRPAPNYDINTVAGLIDALGVSKRSATNSTSTPANRTAGQ